MWVALSNFKARTSSRSTYAFLFPRYGLLLRDTLNSNSDPWLKKALTASSTSSASMLGFMFAISTSILRMKWRTVPLAPITFFKAVSSRPLLSSEHFSSTSRSLERVFLIPRTVTPSSSGLTCFLRSFKTAALPSAGNAIRFLNLLFRLFLSEVFPGWDLHPFLSLCRGFWPLHLRLLGCCVARAHGQLSPPFPQLRSTAHYNLWGCMAALIPDAFNTLGPLNIYDSHYCTSNGKSVAANQYWHTPDLHWRLWKLSRGP